MLLLTCPICSLAADEAAFTCGGDAHVARPQSVAPEAVSTDELYSYLSTVPNAPGWCREQWLCHACESWFVLLRHSVTNRVAAAYRIGDVPTSIPGADA